MKKHTPKFILPPYFKSDLFFLIGSLLFVFCAYSGVLVLSPEGIGIDSDLQNYVQIAVWQREPQYFINDTVMVYALSCPQVPNLFTIIAQYLGDNVAIAYLRTGAIGIFLHLCAYYALGRWIFTIPSAALLLTTLMNITVYWAFGTFWGSTCSDPVPRIFMGGLFALFLYLGTKALTNIKLRPVVLFLTGCCVAIHTVNAATYGAMFFISFLYFRNNTPFKCHINNSILCLISFFLPALLFLSTLPVLQKHLSVEDLNFINIAWNYRFAKDWSSSWLQLYNIIKFYFIYNPLLSFGLVSFVIVYYINNNNLYNKNQFCEHSDLLKLFPGFIIGLICCCLLRLTEQYLANLFSIQSRTQELLRGTRMLIPLAWISIVYITVLISKKINRFLLPFLSTSTLILILLFVQDRQILAAREFLFNLLNITNCQSLSYKNQQVKNLNYKKALDKLIEYTSVNDKILTDVNDLAVRYYAKRSLEPVFKDGNQLLYAQDIKECKHWLTLMSFINKENPDINGAIQISNANILLLNSIKIDNVNSIKVQKKILYHNDDWVLIKLLDGRKMIHHQNP